MADEIVLYGNDVWTSPYVFSAYVVLEEKRLPFRMELLSLEQREHDRPAYRDATLTGRVPALRHGDFWLAESSAIDEYLEEAFPPPRYPRLYPEDLRERARVRMVQAFVRSDLMPIREERPTSTLFQGEKPAPLSAKGRAAAERLVRIASGLVKDPAGFVAGGQFTPADADLALMLMRLVGNGDAVPEPLARWAHAIFERPSIRSWLGHTRFGR